MSASEPIQWKVQWRIDKYRADDRTAPYETVSDTGNLLVYGGASALWQRLIGTGVTAFDNGNAYLGVGDSSTAAAATQTDLQAATNKHREAMDATYPLHTDGTGSSSNATITYKSTFETADATFAWSEWGIFNASTSGRMLNRKVFSGGTKTSAESWSLTISLTLA